MKNESLRLETAWLDDLLLKWRCNVSNVICIETGDYRRYIQLLDYLCNEINTNREYCEHEIFIIDKWNGLSSYSHNAGGKVLRDLKASRYEIKADLEKIEEKLKNKGTILILRNLESVDEHHLKDENLIYAIRSWLFDIIITRKNSIIFLVTSDLLSVLDNYTANLIPLIKPPISTENERKFTIREVVNNLLKKVKGISQEIKDEEVNILDKKTNGLNLYQLENLLVEKYELQKNFQKNKNDTVIDIDLIKKGKAEIIKRSKLIEVYEPEFETSQKEKGFVNIGGYEKVKNYIKKNIISVLDPNNKDRAKAFGVATCRGILFFGPPGTGKTILSKSLAEEIAIPFIKINTENLFSKYLGESGQRFKEAIQLCDQMSPAIVFIDEIDKFGKRRENSGDSGSEETRRVFNQILEWLGDERRNAIIIGTTNRPADLDDALLRPGRIDEKIPIPFPDQEARKQILKIHLGIEGGKKELPPINDLNSIKEVINEVAKKSKLFSGADLEYLVRKARLNAFNREAAYLEPIDLEMAFNSFSIDIDKKQEEQKQCTGEFEDYVSPEFKDDLKNIGNID